MSIKHKVRQGEDIGSIASKYGFLPDVIWQHPNNTTLRNNRKDPNILFQGDIVFIPEKTIKEETCNTELLHRFRRKSVPEKLRIQLLENNESRANESYILEIDGELFSGTTDCNGKIEHSIPPGAQKGKLTVGEDEYQLKLGEIDPVTEIAGIQERLNNLGFYCGPIDGILGPKTQAALIEFQEKHNLSSSEGLDDATRNKLLQVYGC